MIILVTTLSVSLTEITAIFTIILAFIAFFQFSSENWKVIFSSYRRRSGNIRRLRSGLPEADDFFKRNKMNWEILVLFGVFSFFVALGIPSYEFVYSTSYHVGYWQFYLIIFPSIAVLCLFPLFFTEILHKRISKFYLKPTSKSPAKKARRIYSLSRAFSIYWGFLGFGLLYFAIYLYQVIPVSDFKIYGNFVDALPIVNYLLFLLLIYYSALMT